MVAMALNAPTYTCSGSTSTAITLTPSDANCSSVIINNTGSVAMFFVSGTGSAPTAVFPTSATAPLNGSVVAAGAIENFTKRVGHEFISGIPSTGTGTAYIQVGSGE